MSPGIGEPGKGYGAVVCSGAVPWAVRLEGRTFRQDSFIRLKLQLAQGGHQLCSCHATPTPAYRQPALTQTNPQGKSQRGPEQPPEPGRRTPQPAGCLDAVRWKEHQQVGVGEAAFSRTPQGTPEQGLGRTMWDANQGRPPRGRAAGPVPTKHFSGHSAELWVSR